MFSFCSELILLGIFKEANSITVFCIHSNRLGDFPDISQRL